MRAREFLFEEPLEMLEAKGDSSAVIRYNSEIAVLCAFAGVSHFKDLDPKIFEDPKTTLAHIKKFLVTSKNYREELFNGWLARGHEIVNKMKSHYSGAMPTKFGWVGGNNRGPVADIEFVGHELSGVSLKAKGGITLANITTKTIGLTTDRGKDVFQHYIEKEFLEFKEAVFKLAIATAKSKPDTKFGGNELRYTFTYSSEDKTFIMVHKKSATSGPIVETILSENDLLKAALQSNGPWQRPFGDWYQFTKDFSLMEPLIEKVGEVLTVLIENALKNSDLLKHILKFEDKPYYYASANSMFYVPSESDAPDMELKDIVKTGSDGTSQLFKVQVGHVDSTDNARIDLYIRYANGLFTANPTVRFQSLENPQYIAWDKV